MKKKTKEILLVIGTLSILTLIKSCKTVPAGYVGVVYNPLRHGVQEKELSQGWKLISPISKITKYTVATEQQYLSADSREGSKDDESFNIVTSDGKSVRVSMEYSVRFDSEHATNVFVRFRGQSGEDILASYVRGKIKTYASEATSKYSVLDLYGSKRQEINASIFKHVKSQFAKDYIIIDSANLTDVQVDDETKSAIQKRVTAQQTLEAEKIEKEKAVIVAEKLKIQAEGRAIANAQEITIKAKAQAEANRIISDSITEKVLALKEIEKWNGQKTGTTLVNGGTAIVGGK